MKRYEKMSKEEIIAFSLADCTDCPLHDPEDETACRISSELWCEDIKKNYLNEELNMVSRWKTCKTDEDFKKMLKDARDICNTSQCDSCPIQKDCHNYDCVAAYGVEEVEVKE